MSLSINAINTKTASVDQTVTCKSIKSSASNNYLTVDCNTAVFTGGISVTAFSTFGTLFITTSNVGKLGMEKQNHTVVGGAVTTTRTAGQITCSGVIAGNGRETFTIYSADIDYTVCILLSVQGTANSTEGGIVANISATAPGSATVIVENLNAVATDAAPIIHYVIVL